MFFGIHFHSSLVSRNLATNSGDSDLSAADMLVHVFNSLGTLSNLRSMNIAVFSEVLLALRIFRVVSTTAITS